MSDDPRRQQPVTIKWQSKERADLMIGDQLWSEVEWSEKRQEWCIQDAEGHCLKHTSCIHDTAKGRDQAIELAQAMIRDGRLPSPEDAKVAVDERLKRERERREKQPSRVAAREAKEQERAAFSELIDLDFEERYKAPRYWELLADVFDLADPDLWKRNSFAPLRDRLILSLKRDIADIEHSILSDCRRYGKKRYERWVNHPDSGAKVKALRLARAKQLLILLAEEKIDALPSCSMQSLKDEPEGGGAQPRACPHMIGQPCVRYASAGNRELAFFGEQMFPHASRTPLWSARVLV